MQLVLKNENLIKKLTQSPRPEDKAWRRMFEEAEMTTDCFHHLQYMENFHAPTAAEEDLWDDLRLIGQLAFLTDRPDLVLRKRGLCLLHECADDMIRQVEMPLKELHLRLHPAVEEAQVDGRLLGPPIREVKY